MLQGHEVQHAAEAAKEVAREGFNAGETIIGHVANSGIDHPLIHLPKIFGIDFSVTKHVLMIWLVAALLLFPANPPRHNEPLVAQHRPDRVAPNLPAQPAHSVHDHAVLLSVSVEAGKPVMFEMQGEKVEVRPLKIDPSNAVAFEFEMFNKLEALAQ